MSRKRQSYVYILASERNGTLYIGVTSDITRRVFEHQQQIQKSFSKKYNVHQLVYYEVHDEIETAIAREKQLKAWKREWKIQLIEQRNQEWTDLYPTLFP